MDQTSSVTSESQYFDSVIRDHGEFQPFKDRGWQTLRQRFLKMIEPPPGARMLDVGCGTGASRQIYASSVARYIGIDLSHEALLSAATKHPDVKWLHADACDMPFADASFDIVAFSSVLHHIPDFSIALREATRVLRPGGYCFAFDPNLLNPAMAMFRHPRSWLYSANGVSPNERPLLPGELRDAFAAAGLTDILQRGQSDIPYRHVAPRLLRMALGIYNVCDWAFEHSGLGRWFGTFIITSARKPISSMT